ncbi:MAG TPA: hypothetical protein ENN23_00070 [Deltaproteobacteria bacterium]|nr:hypothetical protein [Deltaproteobacteria bacterium]
MAPSLIWIKNIAILLLSLFFLAFGINLKMGAFRLNDPIEFLMAFFSASLVILISLVGIIYFICRFIPAKQDEFDKNETK